MTEFNSNQVINYISKPDPVIVEIGAFRGDDTEVFLGINNSRVIAVEPDPRNIPHLVNLKGKYNNLTIVDRAIYNVDDAEVHFYLSELSDAPDQANFSSSLFAPKLHLELHPRIHFKTKIVVNSITLDTIYKNNNLNIIDFIWADVQGAERLMIEGGINSLKNTKYLYTEYCNNELYETVTSLDKIKDMLPFMTLVCNEGDDVGNALFKNNLL